MIGLIKKERPMKSNIINIISFAVITLPALFLFVPKTEASMATFSGYIRVAGTNAPVPNVWVKWQSGDGDEGGAMWRYAQTGPAGKCPNWATDPNNNGYDIPCAPGQYYFRSATYMPDGFTENIDGDMVCAGTTTNINTSCGQYNTWIDSNLDGTNDTRMMSGTVGSGFGCGNNPHTLLCCSFYTMVYSGYIRRH